MAGLDMLRNMWHRFSELSLKWQIALFTTTLLAVTLLTFGYFAFDFSRKDVTRITLKRLEKESSLGAAAIHRKLLSASSIALRVREFPPIPGIFRCLDNDGTDPDQEGSTTEIWVEQLSTIVKAQLKTHPEFEASLFLQEDGTPMMRVVRDSSGVTEIVSPGKSDQRLKSAFSKAKILPDGHVWLSPPHSEGEIVHIDAACPCFDTKGQFRGVFVIFINASMLFEEAVAIVTTGTLDIVSNEGIYLFSKGNANYPVQKRRFEIDRPVRAALLNAADSPDIYQRLIPGSERPDGVSLIASYHKLFYAPEDPTRYLALAPSILADEALTSVDTMMKRFLLLGLLVLVLAGLVAWRFSQRITSVLSQLAVASDRVASGDAQSEIPVIPGMGEVRQLADSLRIMTGNLQKSAQESDAQQQKMSAILNSTADVIITLNEAGNILAINQPGLDMFGYTEKELLGQDAGRLVPVLTQQDDQYSHAPTSSGEIRSLGGESEVKGHHKHGQDIPIALRVTQLEYGGELLFIATIQDISSRQAAEAERERLFEGIRDAVRNLATASQEIVATTTQQARSAQEQASSVTETATTVEELTHTSEQARGRAEEVAHSAQQAEEVSQAGRNAVNQTFASMEQVREQVQSTAENILALAERAQAISKIITTVDDLADQTNLLAINASIEASRAGEHGKGFAVVATEIKALAEQSKKATEQVRDILGEIQQATNTAVISTEQGTRTMEDARKVVTQAEETINKLADTIAVAARSAAQIVASSGQQSVAMQQINEAMAHIDQATKQTLAATRQAEQSAADLNNLGGRLRNLIESNGQT